MRGQYFQYFDFFYFQADVPSSDHWRLSVNQLMQWHRVICSCLVASCTLIITEGISWYLNLQFQHNLPLTVDPVKLIKYNCCFALKCPVVYSRNIEYSEFVRYNCFGQRWLCIYIHDIPFIEITSPCLVTRRLIAIRKEMSLCYFLTLLYYQCHCVNFVFSSVNWLCLYLKFPKILPFRKVWVRQLLWPWLDLYKIRAM